MMENKKASEINIKILGEEVFIPGEISEVEQFLKELYKGSGFVIPDTSTGEKFLLMDKEGELKDYLTSNMVSEYNK